MKKLIAMLMLLCMCLGLCACASMDKIEENLKGSYKIESMDTDELEEMVEEWDMDMDADDFDVKDALYATHKKKGIGVMVVECGSKAKAEDLAKECEDVVDLLEKYYGSKYSFDSVAEGRFVLVGEEDAIADALDK